MNTKYLMNYCAPSISPDRIEITDGLRELFSKVSNHYTCISGYDYTNGSFRGASYVAGLKLISGEDIMRGGASLPKVLESLRQIWAQVHTPEWQEYYKRKYSVYPNYPVDLRVHKRPRFDTEDDAYKYCMSIKELEFMIMVFEIYVKHNLYLVPCA